MKAAAAAAAGILAAAAVCARLSAARFRMAQVAAERVFFAAGATNTVSTNGDNALTCTITSSPTAASGGDSDPYYPAAGNIGASSCGSNGGNGFVVIQFNTTTVTLSKTTAGGSGAFTFTGNNGWTTQTITTTSGNPTVSGPAVFPTAASSITLNETGPAGFLMTGFTCTDANSATTGNTSSFGSFSGSTATIPASGVLAGAAIQCTVTNTRATVAVQKISLGGTGTFNFSGSTNLASTPTAITTSVGGQAAPEPPAAITVTALNTAVTVTEAAAAGYGMTDFACTDANSAVTGNTGTFGTRAGLVGDHSGEPHQGRRGHYLPIYQRAGNGAPAQVVDERNHKQSGYNTRDNRL